MNVPTVVMVAPLGRSFAVRRPASGTNGAAGEAIVPPVPLQPLESVAVTVMVNVPLCVGVPERTPVDALSARPVGSVPLETLQVAEPRMPLAVKVALKAAPAVPLFAAGFVTVMVWQLI